MSRIRVFIADDHPLVRSGLKMLIQSQDDMEVAGEAGDFIRLKDELGRVQADVLTLDVTMPGGTGMASISAVRCAFPQIAILVVTMHDDPAYVRSALALGAMGYVVKSAADDELISAIRALHEGRTFVDAEHASAMSERVSAWSPRGDAVSAPIEKLSRREREVFALVAQGHTNQAAADRLGLSVKTVETHRARLMEKLGLANRADLVRLALECGLLNGDRVESPVA